MKLKLNRKGLSGTPAEAGVRVYRNFKPELSISSLSGTPAEAGVRDGRGRSNGCLDKSQWNPRRSRGARPGKKSWMLRRLRLSGTPAEAGVRAGVFKCLAPFVRSQWNPRRSRGASSNKTLLSSTVRCLSGTPAEAGVRGRRACPSQPTALSQWNPRRSRGASRPTFSHWLSKPSSQWNPRRSRGARPSPEHIDIACRIGAFIHPPAILFDFCDFKEHLCDSTSNSYCLSSGSTSIHPPIRFL